MWDFRHHIRVRYAETDQMGVAHHAAWVVWLEEVRTAWLRSRGESYGAMEARGVLMPVIELEVRYRSPARFDEELTLDTKVEPVGPSRLRFTTQVKRDGTELGVGVVVIAATNPQGKPIRLPAIT